MYHQTHVSNCPMGFENTFKKAERLTMESWIEELFASGKSIPVYPLKILWLPCTEPMEYPVQVLFSVSRKRFRKAIDRNHIKRKLKEIYRLYKSVLYKELKIKNKKLLISILYIGNDQNPPYDILDSKLQQGIDNLIRSCNIP